MCKELEHYHCKLCGSSYFSREEAVECFWGHTELEILRWVAFQLVTCCHFGTVGDEPMPNVGVSFPAEFIKELNERFQIAEVDERGLLWSLVIMGKRV